MPAAAAHCTFAESCRPPPKPSCVRGTARMCYYSGLTKTSTALPRLAVLSVLSAASSPCPDFC
ncbi:hypothetical protein I7Q31_05815 [Neisseria meningitidis]|nr:hypothetical protein [Neisseria meningitidis]MBH6217333.1 hypothetical protein [Neisseria meningitidis]MBH6232712.1 hypothetical protein [Neisseria meningitidis]MBH6732881.1 hypothetical protein [Neisseria meningitidis]